MKSFIATIVLLSAVITLTALNLHYVNGTVAELCEMLDELPEINDPACIDCADEIKEYWKKKEAIIGLTVSYPFVDRINEQSALLVSTAKSKDLYGFKSAKTLLYDAALDMGRAERFSIENLF